MNELGTVRLRLGREKSVRNRHPWLFSGSIEAAEAEPGQLVNVLSSRGQWLARGYFNRRSQIQVRLLTWNEDEVVDEGFWLGRMRRAIEGRQALPDWPCSSVRLINAETDGLPGMVADFYVDRGARLAMLVPQMQTLGVDIRADQLIRLLTQAVTEERIEALGQWDELTVLERSDIDARRLEGLKPRVRLVSGPEAIDRWTTEGELELVVSITAGHKTGAYLDQALNRLEVARYCRGAEVLNAFAYTGGFGLHALAAGAAHVTEVDTSQPALDLGSLQLERNGLAQNRRTALNVDVFQALRAMRDEGRQFDVVVLDPPKFARNAQQVQGACRGYKDINLLALGLLRPGGVLATFSCSGLISPDLFQKVVFGAAVDAGREAQVLVPLSQAPDHSVSLTFPESHYLKGLLCRVW